MQKSIPKISGSLIILSSDEPFKILMLKRAQNITFGSSYSFPGGKIEKSDTSIAQQHELDIDQYHKPFYNKQFQPSYGESLIAAIRETFEETGLIFNEIPQQMTWQQSLKRFDLFKPFIRLITPYHLKQRFDTQFFVTMIQNGSNQLLNKHYGINTSNPQNILDLEWIKFSSESVHFLWQTPDKILHSYAKGEILLSFPIIHILLILKELKTANDIENFINNRQEDSEFIRTNLTFPYLFNLIKFNEDLILYNIFPDSNYDFNSVQQKETPGLMLDSMIHFKNQNLYPQTQIKFIASGQKNKFTNFTFQNSLDLYKTPFGVLNGKKFNLDTISAKL